jgi:hypothetical protein
MNVYCVIGEFDEYYIKAPHFDAAMDIFEVRYADCDSVVSAYIIDDEAV